MIIQPLSQACKQHRASGCRDHWRSNQCVEIAVAKGGSTPTSQQLITIHYLSDRDISNSQLLYLYNYTVQITSNNVISAVIIIIL